MSPPHGFAIGGAVKFDGMAVRSCDDCGYPTFLPPEEADALWVVCRWCVRKASEGT